jgi:hypothetical protein
MKILAILQNQWFKDPEAVQAIYDRHPDRRNDLNSRYLFMGCLTGRRLQQALGDLCDSIIWEEASPKVGGFSASKFPADPKHIASAIEKHKPDLVLCFGKIAADGVKALNLSLPVLCGPHSAARQNPMPALKEIARKIDSDFYQDHTLADLGKEQ